MSDQLRRIGGRFSRSLLDVLVWREYAWRDQEAFLDMMRSCGVCFVHRKGDEKLGIETEYIAPELLPSRVMIEREIKAQWDADTAIASQVYSYEFLYGGLIRAIIASIGSDAGVSGLYWRDGLCVYEGTTRSRALIEEQRDAGWSGRIVVHTRGGRAQKLLERLCMLVEREHDRIGLTVHSFTKVPRQREATFEGAAEKDKPLAFGGERSTKPRYYVSYAWADPTDPGREKIVDQACEEAEGRGITIIRDKTTLNFGDSISKFMKEIGQGDVIFVVLSDKYLRSPYCMFELFELWRNSRQEKAEFLNRIRVYTLGDAKYSTPIDRVKRAKYWRQQHDALKRAVDDAGLDVLGEEDLKSYKLMQDFSNKVGDILALLANIVQPRNFDDLKKYGFNQPEGLLARI